MPETDVIDLWHEFKTTGDPQLRNRLVMQYAPLVKYVAGRLRTSLPATVDQSDLVSEGVFGLIDAIERFELERGLAFQTYAVPRIRGAILDAMRSQSWAPRSIQDKGRSIQKAHDKLQEQFGRVPTEAEVADELKITRKALAELYAQVSYTSVAAIDDLAIVDPEPAPEDAMEDDAVRSMLVGHIKELRERDQIIVALYYYEGFTLSEIGQVFDVTESRISQLHTRAMLTLRSVIRAAATHEA